MTPVLIGFGANLANPRTMLMHVVAALGGRGFILEDVSPLYRSPAWPPGSGAPDYLNAVLRAQSPFNADDTLQALLSVESALGRARSVRNAPRTVDLDLLDFGGIEADSNDLSLPHPRLTDRAFVLLPLRDVMPDWAHPDGRELADLIAAVDCSTTVRV